MCNMGIAFMIFYEIDCYIPTKIDQIQVMSVLND